jgi:Tfp pilus assembly protein PilN
MIQFNLLPDVKLEYIRAERVRRLVITISVLVTIAAIILLLLLLSVNALQKKHLSDLNRDIKAASSKIVKQTDLNKILTVQNQLKSLSGLHAAKPAASRLNDYLSQVTPNQASINNLTVDFTQHQVTITGTADSLATVNQYVDTLKFTTYTVKGEDGSQNAFSDVVLSSFGLTKDEADYTITLTYNPDIFDITKDVSLTVPPHKITTRSEVEQPADLFKLPIDTPANAGGAQ